MLTRRTFILATALVLGTIGATRDLAGAQTYSIKEVVPARATLAPLYDAHERLATRFRGLWETAIKTASTEDREALVRFLRVEVIAQLHAEGVALYPVFDSLAGGGYATPAAIFDQGAIERLVKQLEDSVGSADRVEFKAWSYALATALESYFTKTEFLVLPVVHQRLSEAGVQVLLVSLEKARTSS